ALPSFPGGNEAAAPLDHSSGRPVAAPDHLRRDGFLDETKGAVMRFAVRSSVVAAFVLIVAATMSAQATFSLGGAGTLTLKGFVSFTAFAQDQNFNFGNGQNAEFPVPPNCEVDCWFGGGDIRNTRLTLVFDGPKIIGAWKAGATVEMDFFGGFGGSA